MDWWLGIIHTEPKLDETWYDFLLMILVKRRHKIKTCTPTYPHPLQTEVEEEEWSH